MMEVVVQLPAFLIWTLRGKGSASRSDSFTPGLRATHAHRIRGCEGPRANLSALKRKIFSVCWQSNTRFLRRPARSQVLPHPFATRKAYLLTQQLFIICTIIDCSLDWTGHPYVLVWGLDRPPVEQNILLPFGLGSLVPGCLLLSHVISLSPLHPLFLKF